MDFWACCDIYNMNFIVLLRGSAAVCCKKHYALLNNNIIDFLKAV